ncbi:MAG: hypothetical protein LBR82_04415 [Desulfovibrio sp.]|jgi:transposase-like protein|nr:hypothetical protein [Desulfovibrio sp.]
MPTCKKCGSGQAVKSGVIAGKQRFLCKECGCNFREGDARTSEKVAAKKALCVLLYAMAKGSFRMMGRILNTNHALIYRWIRTFGESLPEPAAAGGIKQMQFDEILHFIQQKKESYGSSKPLIVAHGKLWDGCSAVMILELFNDDTIRSGI